MDGNPIGIFLSGTRLRLEAFWRAAAETLRQAFPDFEVHSMESAEPEDIPADHWSRREATRTGVLLGLIGRRYGYVPGGSDRSVTEYEYDVAGQVGIDRLMFLTSADADAAVSDSEDHHRRSEAFRLKISADLVRGEVATPEEFAQHAADAIRQWERRTLRGSTQEARVRFAPMLKPDALLSHTEPLIGQTGTLERLVAFVGSSNRIAILHAPWGRGKSRLLVELASHGELLQRAGAVRYVAQDAQLNRQHLGISAADPTLLVLDDAHRRTSQELSLLLAFLNRCDPNIKLLLVSRTGGVPGLDAAIRSQDVPMSGVEHIELPALTQPDQHRLITTILGRSDELTTTLARRTLGSPLAGLLGARLIRRGSLFSDIEGSPDFIAEVIDRFDGALLDSQQFDSSTREHLQQLLQVVALCGPIHPGRPEERDALAAFLDWPPDVLLSRLQQLEDFGLVDRTFDRVAIPVDGVRESLAARGCVNTHDELTGLAERALRRLAGVFRGNLLRMLAQVDAPAGSGAVDLIQSTWPILRAEFLATTPEGRREILRDLEGVGPHRPREVVQFAGFALDTGPGTPPDENELIERFRRNAFHDLITVMLRGTLHDSESVPEACDLLWRMAQDDPRPAPQTTDCPERALLDLAEYEAFRPVQCSVTLMDWIETRLVAGDVAGHRLASYLRPLLSKELRRSFTDGTSLTFWGESLPFDRARPLHERAIALLERVADSADVRSVVAAISALSSAVLPLGGLAGTGANADAVARWQPIQLDALARLRSFTARHPSAVSDLIVLKHLKLGLHPRIQQPVREAAVTLRDEIIARRSRSLELAFMPGSGPPWGPDAGSRAVHEAEVESAIAPAIRASNRSPDELTGAMQRAWDSMREAELQPSALVFLRAYASLDPAFAEYFLEALQFADHPVARDAFPVFDFVRLHQPDRWKRAVENGVEGGGPCVQFAVAIGLFQTEWRNALGTEVVCGCWGRLLRSPDQQVRSQVLHGMREASEIAAARRIDLLLDCDPVAADVLDSWMMAVLKLYPSLSSEQRKSISITLTRLPALDYFAEELLKELCRDEPEAVADFLLARVAAAAPGRDAVPSDMKPDCLAGLPSGARVRVLIGLGDYLRHERAAVAWEAHELFNRLGGHDALRDTRMGWVADGTVDALLLAVRSFRGQDADSLFTQESVVVGILEAAARLGAEALSTVSAELLSIANVSGVMPSFHGYIESEARSAAARYPGHVNVHRFYDALAAEARQRSTDSS